MVAVAMRMNDHKLRSFAAAALGPFFDQIGYERGRGFSVSAGVFQQNLVLSVNQIQKRLFVIQTTGFAQNPEVAIVLPGLPIGHSIAGRATDTPRGWKYARFQFRAIWNRGSHSQG